MGRVTPVPAAVLSLEKNRLYKIKPNRLRTVCFPQSVWLGRNHTISFSVPVVIIALPWEKMVMEGGGWCSAGISGKASQRLLTPAILFSARWPWGFMWIFENSLVICAP